MTDQELFELNRKGFIPGPGEEEEAFLRRIKSSEEFFLNPPAPFLGMEKVPEPHWDWVRHYLKECYDFEPRSLAAYYSNRKLAPWQGAVSWIIEGASSGPLCAVQLRKGFSKGNYLRLYSRDEILAHEAVHAARCAFNEPGNEEFFAYATSSTKWRRKLGPILKRPWEAFLLFAALGLGGFLGNFLPAALLTSFAFFRLNRQHLRLKKASSMLSKITENERMARALLLRLTDREIDLLAAQKPLQDDGSLRFRIIRSYMKPITPSGV